MGYLVGQKQISACQPLIEVNPPRSCALHGLLIPSNSPPQGSEIATVVTKTPAKQYGCEVEKTASGECHYILSTKSTRAVKQTTIMGLNQQKQRVFIQIPGLFIAACIPCKY
jgi:hypothetical protein